MNPIFKLNIAERLGTPFFTALLPLTSRFAPGIFPTLQDCNALLAAHSPPITVVSGQPLRFVAQEYGKLSFEEQYEPSCYLKGEVPSRDDNWHDLFNALVWLTFPKAKAAINARHYQALTDTEKNDKATNRSQRGSVRDTCTLLDESGVIVPFAEMELANLLRNFQWKELFWHRRAQIQIGMGFYVFGHGLYEKALRPYVGLTGQGLLLPVEKTFFTWPLAQRLAHLDGMVADYLAAHENCRTSRELSPVPLLGVPGWAVENDSAAYYDNTEYFRTGRHGHSAS